MSLKRILNNVNEMDKIVKKLVKERNKMLNFIERLVNIYEKLVRKFKNQNEFKHVMYDIFLIMRKLIHQYMQQLLLKQYLHLCKILEV